MCLQMLESLAGQDAAGSARQAAAWCLAAAAAAGRAAYRGAQSSQAGASPPQGAHSFVHKAAKWLRISFPLCKPLSTLAGNTHRLAPPWGLPAACRGLLVCWGEGSQADAYAYWPAGKSAQGASTKHAAALAARPADSAMKALVEHLAGSSSVTGNSPLPYYQRSIYMLMFLGYSVATPEHGVAHGDCRPAGRGCFWDNSKLQGIGAQVLGSCRAAPPLGLGPDLHPLPEVSTLPTTRILPLSSQSVPPYVRVHDGLNRSIACQAYNQLLASWVLLFSFWS